MDCTFVAAVVRPATDQLGWQCGFTEAIPPAIALAPARAPRQHRQRLRLQSSQTRPAGPAVSVPLTAAALAVAARAVARRRPGPCSLWTHQPAGLCKHSRPRPLCAGVQAAEAEAASTQVHPRRTAGLAALAYVLSSLLHRRILRVLAAGGAAAPPVGLVAGLHAAAFLAAAALRGRRPGSGGINVSLVAAVAAAEILSWVTLGGLVGAGDLALTVALLSGCAIPYTMLLSQLLLKRRFAPLAWAGALLVAAGVAVSSLGPPANAPGPAEAALLVGALAVPGLALVAKEALLTGSRPPGIAAAAFLTSAAQLVASAALPDWPSAAGFSAGPPSVALLWSPGCGSLWLYALASGGLRLSLLWALRVSSASTVQLLNALALSVGVAVLASTSVRNLLALLLSCSGGALYFWAHTRQLPALGSPQSQQAREESLGDAAPAQRSPEEARRSLQSAFLEEMRAAGAEERRRAEARTWQEARLERLKRRWQQVEEEQSERVSQQTDVALPRMFAAEDPGDEAPEENGGGEPPPATAGDNAPLTSEELKQIEMDEAYLGMMWKKWMLEHPAEWRRQEEATKEVEG